MKLKDEVHVGNEIIKKLEKGAKSAIESTSMEINYLNLKGKADKENSALEQQVQEKKTECQELRQSLADQDCTNKLLQEQLAGMVTTK
jgi:hypothetical protein